MVKANQTALSKLENELTEALDELREAKEQAIEAKQENYDRYQKQLLAEKLAKETQDKFADLKTRLHAAETSNQFMRGYLARVQEDDVVREQLVTTGDPAGDQQLVPKRKPVQFARPDDFTYPTHSEHGAYMNQEERRKRAKHWIIY